MTQRASFRLVILLAAAISSSCFLFDQDTSESLGQVRVVASLSGDTCGPGATGSGSTLEYDVEITLAGETITWLSPQGSTAGRVDDDGSFCFESSSTWAVRAPDPWLSDPGCDMMRVDRLCGQLELTEDEVEAGTVEQRLVSVTGSQQTFVSAATGSYCPEMIGLSSGQYITLPCQTTYVLAGTPVAD